MQHGAYRHDKRCVTDITWMFPLIQQRTLDYLEIAKITTGDWHFLKLTCDIGDPLSRAPSIINIVCEGQHQYYLSYIFKDTTLKL